MKNRSCPLPNLHIFLQPQGVRPCCSYTTISILPLDKFWNSDELANINPALEKGQPLSGCQHCQNKEKIIGVSTRLEALSEWGKTAKQEAPTYLDLRLSNLCNFRCRSCEPDFSSGIDIEAQHNYKLQSFYRSTGHSKIQYIDEQTLEYVIGILPNLKILKLAGGEPTCMPEVKKILQHIIDHKLHNIDIQITTNGSFKDEFWIGAMKKLPSMHWTISLDGTEHIAELVRDGTNWPLVLKNLYLLAQHSHSLLINTTISNLNILHLAPLISLVNNVRRQNIDKRNGIEHIFQPVSQPMHMMPWNLPTNLRSIAIARIQTYLGMELSDTNKQLFTKLINALESQPFDAVQWERSCLFNSLLDQARKQNHSVCFE